MRKRRGVSKKKWYLPSILLFFIVLILAISLIKNKSPLETVKGLFVSEPEPGNLLTYPNEELVKIIQVKENQIDSLSKVIQDIRQIGLFVKAAVRVESGTLNMREGPNLNTGLVSQIPDGAHVMILGYDDEEVVLSGQPGYWCEIFYEGNRGWVWGNYLIQEN
jgi:hypothetical protein